MISAVGSTKHKTKRKHPLWTQSLEITQRIWLTASSSQCKSILWKNLQVCIDLAWQGLEETELFSKPLTTRDWNQQNFMFRFLIHYFRDIFSDIFLYVLLLDVHLYVHVLLAVFEVLCRFSSSSHSCDMFWVVCQWNESVQWRLSRRCSLHTVRLYSRMYIDQIILCHHKSTISPTACFVLYPSSFETCWAHNRYLIFLFFLEKVQIPNQIFLYCTIPFSYTCTILDMSQLETSKHTAGI